MNATRWSHFILVFLVSTNKVVAMSVLKDDHVSCGLGRPKGILQVWEQE